MKNRITLFLTLLIGLGNSLGAEDFGISPEDTHRLKTEGEQKVFFVDVRDPVEIQFTGFTDVVDQNIPFVLVDRSEWLEDRGVFRMYRNPRFAEQMETALQEWGGDKESKIITMCRSGSARGEPSAAYLRENGFPNAYFVIHGFQGDVLQEGEHEGFRLKNGWQNSGLPWSYRLNPEKIYRPGEK